MLVKRILAFAGIILVLIALYYELEQQGLIDKFMDTQQLKTWLAELGYIGPVAISILMAVAIIINPIPSAPIALAAGAMYGHTWGTVYIVFGATLGAIGAFLIARVLGQDLVRRLVGEKVQLGWLGSQNAMMGLVAVSRLIPFISFDLLSYGAGLTPLKFWRFVLATVIGLIPASFLLAHFGGELSPENLDRAFFIIMLLGGITLVPILIHLLHKKFRAGRRSR